MATNNGTAEQKPLVEEENNNGEITLKSDKHFHQSLDDVLYDLKPYGWYQLFNHVLHVYFGVLGAGNVAGSFYSLGGMKPDYFCNDTEPQAEWTDTCQMIRNCQNLTTVTQFHSLYEEFEWACQPSYIVAGFSTVATIVLFVGYFIGGMVTDMVGRRPILLISMMLYAVTMIVIASAPNWQVYMGASLVQQLAPTLYISSAYALTQETVCVKHRLLQGFASQWIFGYIIVGLLAYLTGEWRLFLWVILAVCTPLIIGMFFLCESPRWLLQRGRVSEARKSLNYIAWWNRVTIRYTDDQVARIDIGAQHNTKRFEHPLRVFGSRKLLLYALPLGAISVVYRQIYYVILMDIKNLAGNPFLNVAMLGALRAWTPPVAVALEHNFVSCGRRMLIVVSQVLCAFCFILMVCARQIPEMPNSIGTSGALMGYAFSAGLLWNCYKQMTSELYPTEMRANALSVYSLIASFGNILAAQLVYLAEYWPPMPYAVTVVECIISAVLCALILPETKNKPLKDTLEQLEAKNED